MSIVFLDISRDVMSEKDDTCIDEHTGEGTGETATEADDCTNDDVMALLTCSACKEQYEDPKLLACLHSFCARCIRVSKDKIVCHYCRTSQSVPDNGLSGVSPSYILADLKSVSKQPAEAKQVCEACEEEKLSEFLCPTCNVTMCDACRVAHRNLRITKNHEVLPAKSAKESPLGIISARRQKICETDGVNITYLCKTCGVFVCHTEAIKEHTGHQLETLVEIRNKWEKPMADLKRKAKQTIKFSQNINSFVQSYESKVEENFGEIELQIDRTISDIVKMLHEQAFVLKDNIQSKKEHEVAKMAAILQEASNVERSSTIVRNVMQKVSSSMSDIDALTLYSSCEQILAEAKMDRLRLTHGNELFFKPSDLMLQIQTSTDCGTIREIGNYPDFTEPTVVKTIKGIPNVSGIAKSKYGEIALVSFWDNKCVLIRPEGRTIRDVSKQVSRPWDVAFTSDSAIVVSECGERNGCGKLELFSPAGTFVKNIQEGFKSPGGLAVDMNDHLLVCDENVACVHVLSLDGTLMDQIKSQESEYQFQGPMYVTTNINDDVIVCDDHRSIKIFTSTGHKKSVYKVDDKHYLQGLCTDIHGQILVVDSMKNGIHVLTANGTLRRFIVLKALRDVGEIQSICTNSATTVLIAGKSSHVFIVQLFQDHDTHIRFVK